MSAALGTRRADDGELAGLVASGAEALAMSLEDSQIDALIGYVRLIERWNATYNLTAVRDPRDMVTQHIVDSLAAVAALVRRRGSAPGEHVLDVGSGAGLPGVVLGVAAPERRVVCIDSVGKKAAFIAQVAGVLGLKNVTALHGRVETLRHEGFDVIASRALASVVDFVAGSRHLAKEGGVWMAMKGKIPGDELAALKGLSFHVEPLAVPGLAAQRCIVWINATIEASARL